MKRAPLGLKARTDSLFVERSMSFMVAHRRADAIFVSEFQDADSELTESGRIVLLESEAQFAMAEAELDQFDKHVVELAASHKFCKILLTCGIQHMAKLVSVGLLKATEAEPFIEELEELLGHVISGDVGHHVGEAGIAECEKEDGPEMEVEAPQKSTLVEDEAPQEKSA